MRGLAEYVMRGRREALLVALIAAAVPMLFWISAVVIGLVTLRRGASDGFTVMLWAALPTFVHAWYGDPMPLAALFGTAVSASVLRLTVSWPWALCTTTALGLLLSGGLYTVGRAYLANVEAIVAAFYESISKQATDPAAASALRVPTTEEIAGMFGLVHGLTLVICLVLSRWWQALLYNPGGFRTEFHALRLHPVQALGLVVLAVGLNALGPGFRIWAWIALVPLLFAGIGLMHALLADRAGSGWLGLFYAALLILPPVRQLLIVLAALDGWIDLRARLRRPPRGGGTPDG